MPGKSSVNDNFNSIEQVTAALRETGLESTNVIVGIDFTASNELKDSEKQMPSPSLGSSLKAFSNEDLVKATEDFSESHLLGQGGSGRVYKGILPDGKLVAVKQLKSGSTQGWKEFMSEVNIISSIHHKNLVYLLGYCVDGAHRMLVYEFVPNSTLDFHLHGNRALTMSWENRMKIALGTAKVLAYLLEDCQPRIIHRDIKPANILIDENFNPKLADFGLARYLPEADTYYTRAMGTLGYFDPNSYDGQLTEEMDVYSFGVVLLELITGQKALKQNPPFNLVNWAKTYLRAALKGKKYDGLVDRMLRKNFNSEEMKRMVICAAKCVHKSREKRPRMGQILRELEGDLSQAEKGCRRWWWGNK